MNSFRSGCIVVVVFLLSWGACFAEEETNDYSATEAALYELDEIGYITPELREAVETEAKEFLIAKRPEAAEFPEWYWKKTMKQYFAMLKVFVYMVQGRSDSQIAETYEWKLLVELSYPVYEDLPYMDEDDHRLLEEFFKCILTTNGTGSCLEVLLTASSAPTK